MSVNEGEETVEAAGRPLAWSTIERTCAERRPRLVIYRATIDSTNRLARELARSGAADGTLVLADEQTQGRGRLGRSWTAPPRTGIALSLIVRLPKGAPLYTLSMAASLAIHAALYAHVGVRCTLKWPNDVLIDGRKVSGILVELDLLDGCWAATVGIGVNVHAAPPIPTATSVAATLGYRVSREEMIVSVLDTFDRCMDDVADDAAEVVRRWSSLIDTIGRRVDIYTPDGTLNGIVSRIDEEGALLLADDAGHMHIVRAGDVSLSPLPFEGRLATKP